MNWKGAVFLVALIAVMGIGLRYADPGLTSKLLSAVGLDDYLAIAETDTQLPKAGGHGAPAPAAEYERGPHNGRMLRDGNFALEVTIFETGVPPEFHFYMYDEGKPVSPSEVDASVELARLGGNVDKLTFSPQGDYLKSNAPVIEPHSFDVTVTAAHEGKSHSWKFSSYEGRTSITEEAASAAGMKVEPAGPVSIEESIVLTGTVVLNQNRTTKVKARFPGLVRKVLKSVGETVKVGEVLALVESNVSLQEYEVRAPIDGVVLERNTNVGDVTGDDPLFTVSDLSSVWAEFHVFSQDLDRAKAGQKIRVKSLQGDAMTESTVQIFTPVAELSSQSVLARVTLENGSGHWRPGMTVRGEVIVDEHQVPLAVKSAALQRFRDFTVVFAKFGTTYEVRMLELGTNDDTWTEVKGGLKPGTNYVSENSFLVKADIEKSGASHDH